MWITVILDLSYTCEFPKTSMALLFSIICNYTWNSRTEATWDLTGYPQRIMLICKFIALYIYTRILKRLKFFWALPLKSTIVYNLE